MLLSCHHHPGHSPYVFVAAYSINMEVHESIIISVVLYLCGTVCYCKGITWEESVGEEGSMKYLNVGRD